MNLKRVVASMWIIGLVGCPAFAGHHTKHYHHRHSNLKKAEPIQHKHDEYQVTAMNRDAKGEQNYKGDYKDMEPTKPVALPCVISQQSIVLNHMNQNQGRAIPNSCDTEWYKRIHLNGGVNIDWLKMGNKSSNFTGVNYQNFSLNDVYLNVGVDANSWAKAFASISFNTATINTAAIVNDDDKGGSIRTEYSSAYNGDTSHRLQLEQAYVTLGNLEESPVFLQIGEQFQDFSRYQIHPITRSLTQSLSEMLESSLKVGLISPSGFNGSIAVFDDPISKVKYSHKRNASTNYGLSLGYDQVSTGHDQLGFSVGAGWIYNLMAANDIAYHVKMNHAILGDKTNGYERRVGGLALYGDVNSGPFLISARYTSALKRFALADLPSNAHRESDDNLFSAKHGAKPWAAGIQLGYAFDNMSAGMDLSQNVYVGYQASRQTSALGLPRSRWLVGYNVVPCKNAEFGLEWDYDRDFNKAHGGSGKNYNLITLRSAVKFG